MNTRAQFPNAKPGAGMYESFYLRAVAPAEPVGVWLRCTVHKRPGREPTGALWCTVFDAGRGRPYMHKLSGAAPSVPSGGWIAIGESATLGPVHARGECGQARWDLRIEADAPPLSHLPAAWMYRAGLPRTKPTSPAPSARFAGTLELADRTLRLDGWRGMIGHNWGAEHAARWIWLHGIDFAQAPDAWLDVALGRIAIAGRMTPWVANGAVSFGGRRWRVGGLARRGLRVRERPDRCDLHLPGPRGLAIDMTVSAPPDTVAGWRYADPGAHNLNRTGGREGRTGEREGHTDEPDGRADEPDGRASEPGGRKGEHEVANCSIAALDLALTLPGEPEPKRLTSAHGGAYELGTSAGEPSELAEHGIPIAPFPDG